jgi:hypothetical protein
MHLASREETLATLGEHWQENATFIGNIPLHPLGELSFLTFVEAYENPEDFRTRLQVIFRHAVVLGILMIVFIPNFVTSINLIYRRPKTLAPFCCFIQTLAGVICGVISITSLLPGGPSCRTLSWLSTTTVRIGDLCVGTVLLQKAYLVHHRSRWLLIFIPVIIIAPIVLLYISWISPTVITPDTGCVFIYPDYYPWLRFGFHAPMNIALSGIFLNVAYRHYKQFGTAAWEKLARKGIQICLALLISNFIITIIIAFELFGVFSILLTSFDWFISTIFLVAHVNNRPSNTSNTSHDKSSLEPIQEMTSSRPGPLLPHVTAKIVAHTRSSSTSHTESTKYARLGRF